MRKPPLNSGYTHDAAVTMGAVSVAIQAAKSRKYLAVVNCSTTAGEIVWLNCAGAAAVVGKGIPLGPGAVYQPAVPPTGAIAGISASGTPNVAVTWA